MKFNELIGNSEKLTLKAKFLMILDCYHSQLDYLRIIYSSSVDYNELIEKFRNSKEKKWFR